MSLNIKKYIKSVINNIKKQLKNLLKKFTKFNIIK